MQSAWRQWGVVTTALLCTVQMADGSVWRFSDATSLDGWDVVGHAVPGPAGLTLSSTNGTAAGVQVREMLLYPSPLDPPLPLASVAPQSRSSKESVPFRSIYHSNK